MAQHDMNIANQGFPATRADLNNALQAIATNNSGTSAPSTTFANQWFYNETSNKLFIRNEANNAFIEVATLDQTNNEWQITTGVVQAKDSDGLALKTDDGTTRFFIKDSDGSTTFTIGSKGAAFVPNTDSTWNALEIFQDRGVTNSASGIAFRSQSGTKPAGIVSVAGNTTGGEEALAFMTSDGNNTGERMRILAAGGLTFNGDTAAANALDDYEEGTWNPSVNAGTINGTSISFSGHYTKIGRQVFVGMVASNTAGDIQVPSFVQFGGVPFSIANHGSSTIITEDIDQFSRQGFCTLGSTFVTMSACGSSSGTTSLRIGIVGATT